MSCTCDAVQISPEQIKLIEDSFEIGLQVKLILEEVLKYDLCKCPTFTREQLVRARRLAQDVDIILDRLLVAIFFEDPDFLYYNYLLFARLRMAAAINELTVLVTSDFCAEDSEACFYERVFERALENVQIANSNLLTILKFLAID